VITKDAERLSNDSESEPERDRRSLWQPARSAGDAESAGASEVVAVPFVTTVHTTKQ
jgi:hypothetical protein